MFRSPQIFLQHSPKDCSKWRHDKKQWHHFWKWCVIIVPLTIWQRICKKKQYIIFNWSPLTHLLPAPSSSFLVHCVVAEIRSSEMLPHNLFLSFNSQMMYCSQTRASRYVRGNTPNKNQGHPVWKMKDNILCDHVWLSHLCLIWFPTDYHTVFSVKKNVCNELIYSDEETLKLWVQLKS